MKKIVAFFLTLASTGLPAASFPEFQKLGYEAFQRGDYRTAAEHWNRAKQLAAEGPAESAAVTAANLASLDYQLGNVKGALAGYREALRFWEAAGPDGPGLRSTLRHLGDVLRSLGENDEARRVLGRLASLLERDASPDVENFARLRLSLARIEAAVGQVNTATSLYRQVLDAPVADVAVRAAAWDGLGEVHVTQGKLDEAEQALREALSLWDSLGQTVRAASTANRLGARWLAARKPRPALPYLRRALAVYEQKGIGGMQLACTLNNLGQAHRFLGDEKTAVRYLERARNVAAGELGANHPILASILVNLGDLAMLHKRYEEAELYLRQSMVIHEARLTHWHPDIAQDYIRLANVHLRRKQFDAACQALGEALAIRERMQLPFDTEQAEWYEMRAGLLRRGENYAEAAQLEAKAMRIRVRRALH